MNVYYELLLIPLRHFLLFHYCSSQFEFVVGVFRRFDVVLGPTN